MKMDNDWGYPYLWKCNLCLYIYTLHLSLVHLPVRVGQERRKRSLRQGTRRRLWPSGQDPRELPVAGGIPSMGVPKNDG